MKESDSDAILAPPPHVYLFSHTGAVVHGVTSWHGLHGEDVPPREYLAVHAA